MSNRTPHTSADPRGYVRTSAWSIEDPDESPSAIARGLGPIVYAARAPGGLIKIGFSSDLTTRIGGLGGFKNILAVTPGTLAEEQTMHARLTASLNHGREYYNPTPEVLAVVNAMRVALHFPPISA